MFFHTSSAPNSDLSIITNNKKILIIAVKCLNSGFSNDHFKSQVIVSLNLPNNNQKYRDPINKTFFSIIIFIFYNYKNNNNNNNNNTILMIYY